MWAATGADASPGDGGSPSDAATPPADLSAELLSQIVTGLPCVREAVWLPEAGSTQEEARARAAKRGPGVLVVADRQSGGRGRLGRGWFSPAGGLWMSLALAPRRPRGEWPILTALAALALRDALQETAALRAGLKWPNDLLCRGRKIAGILAESGAPDWVVLGIGLNVTQRTAQFPPELRPQATSIQIETGRSPSRAFLLRALLQRLEFYLGLLARGESAALRGALREASLLLGRIVTVGSARSAVDAPGVAGEDWPPADALRGRVVDIGPLGELILEELPSASARAEEAAAAGEEARRVRLSAGEVLAVEPPLS